MLWHLPSGLLCTLIQKLTLQQGTLNPLWQMAVCLLNHVDKPVHEKVNDTILEIFFVVDQTNNCTHCV